MTKRPYRGTAAPAGVKGDLLVEVVDSIRLLLHARRRQAGAVGDLTARTAIERVVSEENMVC